MIKQIPKWLEDNDVLPDLCESNGLDASGISLVKFINSPQYSNKRMIIKANKETTVRIKLNDKLKLGFGYVARRSEWNDLLSLQADRPQGMQKGERPRMERRPTREC